jgi:hypothetical protein
MMKGILQWAVPVIFDVDEVMVLTGRNGRIVCLTDHRVLRIHDAKLMHITVAPCLGALGHDAPPLIMIPLLKSCMREVQALHNGRCFISTAKRGWVTKAVFAEWAELFCK